VRRLRAWIVSRLAVPELGEIRRFGDTDWMLVSIQNSRYVYEDSTLVLTYLLPFECAEKMFYSEVSVDGTGSYSQEETSSS
jgi:hypothetical protein